MMIGHSRRDHDSSRDRHRERDRDRSWDRSKDRDRDRESDRYRKTDSRRRRSRERETDSDHGRQRSHRPKSLSRSPRRRSREHSREHLTKEEHAKERYMRTFARGGRIFEDNGGLPSLQQQGIEDRWAGFSEPSATRYHNAPVEHQQQYVHHGMSNQYQGRVS
ncbi:hypothetical protein COCOBI_03-4870 [Coccomyxa sp. Obi]|nr:hypothetical protein COCOBI_03-4870 [Coccomyxa sp. Obi]